MSEQSQRPELDRERLDDAQSSLAKIMDRIAPFSQSAEDRSTIERQRWVNAREQLSELTQRAI